VVVAVFDDELGAEMKTQVPSRRGMMRRRLNGARGISLLEVVFAMSLIMIVSLGLLPLGAMATLTTENQGHLMARSTEYAQDKLEQLLALAFGDAIGDTRYFPAALNGGSGLAEGGSDDPANPENLYVDYLEIDGDLIAPSAGVPNDWFYKRVWRVEDISPTLKRITVVATVKVAAGGVGRVPQSTVVALKASPF
jgi:hypothetical protein